VPPLDNPLQVSMQVPPLDNPLQVSMHLRHPVQWRKIPCRLQAIMCLPNPLRRQVSSFPLDIHPLLQLLDLMYAPLLRLGSNQGMAVLLL